MEQERKRLSQYLSALRANPPTFAPGFFDCLVFTNEAWRAMHGQGWADDWIGRYSGGDRFLPAEALRAEFGYRSLFEALDDRPALRRCPHIPPAGALVVSRGAGVPGKALGIANGHRAVFLGPEGIAHLPITEIQHSWVKS